MILIAVCAFMGDQVKNNFQANHHIFVASLQEPKRVPQIVTSPCTHKQGEESFRRGLSLGLKLLGWGFTAPPEQPKVS